MKILTLVFMSLVSFPIFAIECPPSFSSKIAEIRAYAGILEAKFETVDENNDPRVLKIAGDTLKDPNPTSSFSAATLLAAFQSDLAVKVVYMPEVNLGRVVSCYTLIKIKR